MKTKIFGLLVFVFLPFFIVWNISLPTIFEYLQWSLLIIIALLMFVPTHKLLSMKRFQRSKAIKFMGVYYVFNFALVPIMLMNLNPWVGILIFLPGLGFILSNIILHGTIFQPKTM